MTAGRRVLREFSIDELSMVDRPAQGHARMTLMKAATKEQDMNQQKTTDDEPQAFANFEDAVAHLGKLHGFKGTEAMSMAAQRFPDLLKQYNEEGRQQLEKAAQDAAKARAKSKEVTDFEMIVDAVAERDGVSRTVAMERARKEKPERFRAYQNA